MKSRSLLLAVGLAVAGVVAAVTFLREDSPIDESSPAPTQLSAAASSPPPPALAELPPPPAEPRSAAQPDATRKEVEATAHEGAPVIRGRVVAGEEGPPLPGIEVELTSRTETIARAVSDAEGRFTLPFSKSIRLAVQVVEPEGWIASRRRQRIKGDEPPAQELVFVLSRDTRSFFRGRALDESNGEPLPDLKVNVGGFGGEVVTTDDAGFFTTRKQFPAGELEVTLVTADGAHWGNSQRSVAHDDSGATHDIEFPIGPTYDLSVVPPPGQTLEGLQVFLADEAHGCPWMLPPSASRGEALHLDTPLWVRFLPLVDYGSEGELARLWVTTADGRWLGSCEVPARSRRGSGVHEVALEPCGSVEVILSPPDSKRAPDVDVELRWPSGVECWGPLLSVDSNGRVRFRLVPPGDYLLRVDGNRTRTIERTIQVAAGEPTVLEFALEPLPEGGSVTVVVRTQSGSYEATDEVALRSSSRRADLFVAKVQWAQEDGALVGRFAFDDVPAGEYELFFFADSHFAVRPAPAVVSPPMSDVELLCLDGAGGFSLVLEGYDAPTKEPLREISIEYGTGSGYLSFSKGTIHGHRIELGRFPRDVVFDWEARSEGYLSLKGNLASFEQVGTKDGEPLLQARIELEPGWGGRLWVYAESGPIAHAVVLCDGAEVGRTNQRGELFLALPSRPSRFEVRHPDFVMDYPAAGELPDSLLSVVMKPRE